MSYTALSTNKRDDGREDALVHSHLHLSSVRRGLVSLDANAWDQSQIVSGTPIRAGTTDECRDVNKRKHGRVVQDLELGIDQHHPITLRKLRKLMSQHAAAVL